MEVALLILAVAVSLCVSMLTAAWIYHCGRTGTQPVQLPKLSNKSAGKVPALPEKQQSPYPVVKA